MRLAESAERRAAGGMSRSKPKPTGENVEHRAQRLAREHRERLERYTRPMRYPATPQTSCTRLLCMTAIPIGQPGSEIAKLVGHGFVEISTANAGLGVI
jgi:hypothetical protein